MTDGSNILFYPSRSSASGFLVAGIILASVTEAIAGTALSLGRADIMGDISTTPDEFAWLDTGYVGAKLIGFLTASSLMKQVGDRRLMIVVTLLMGATCGIAALTTHRDFLVVLRVLQGFSGGALLVAGQAILFGRFQKTHQPVLQALFAIGAVVAPATVALALQGWLLDTYSWEWIFFVVFPASLAAVGLVMIADETERADDHNNVFDWLGFSLISMSFFCFTYVLSRGSRWDWFEEPRIVWLSLAGATCMLLFLARQAMVETNGLIDLSAFRSSDFLFAFIVSFVAGAALFGSAFLIPLFVVSVLAFTATSAGYLLLPSSALFAGTLMLAAYLFQKRRVPPFATVPVGIMLIMIAMYLLSGSTSESGSNDMMVAVLLRGVGLGFLFLSITLIAFSNLTGRNLASGIGMFNAGRQLGGLLGVAGLQTLIEHDVAANHAVLASHVTGGSQIIAERLLNMTTMLTREGFEAVTASRVALSLLARTVTGQSTVIAFNAGFMAIALLFLIAAPLLVVIKIGLRRFSRVGSSTSTAMYPDPDAQDAIEPDERLLGARG